jgi:hypothetical protein
MINFIHDMRAIISKEGISRHVDKRILLPQYEQVAVEVYKIRT